MAKGNIISETGLLVQSRCPNKLYVFNRYPHLKFVPPQVSIVHEVSSRQQCQDLCLAERQIPCRSASFQISTSLCFLNEQTKSSQPRWAQPDTDFDYLENVCLSGETRCGEGGINHFVQEQWVELNNRS